MNFYLKKKSMEISRIDNIYTGKLRPRHARFNNLAKKVVSSLNIEFATKYPSYLDRLKINLNTKLVGYRKYNNKIKKNTLAIVHHALPQNSSKFLLEIDLPMSLNNYNILNHRRSWKEVRNKLESKECKGIIVFSEWAKRNLVLHYGPKINEKTFVLYPPIYSNQLDFKLKNKNIDFTFIATQFLMKGGHQVLEAFNNLQKSGFNDIKLTIVTRLNELKNIPIDFKNNKNIKWIEANLNDEEITKLLKCSKCLLHPTLSDSFGVVVLEAISQGCAIIASNMASFPEMVSSENGFLINPPIATSVNDTYITEFGNSKYFNSYLETLNLDNLTEEIFNNMKTLISNPETTKSLMQGSLNKFSNKFSETVWISNFKDILKKVVELNV